jgi:molybdate transport system substrate-binding protein
MTPRVSLVGVTLLVCALASSACQVNSAGHDNRVTVFAASSLTESFNTIADHFEAANPGIDVAVSYGSSSTLATQVIDGASADVIATASPASMQPVVDEGLTTSAPDTFTTNSVAVALPHDNPAGLTSVQELEQSRVKVAVCVQSAPCGGVAAALFDAAHLSVTPVTEEVDVKTVLAKVIAGEVDAGVVYASDVLTAGNDIASLPIPADAQVTTDYVIASLTTSTDNDLAQQFVDAVESADGQRVLAKGGFTAP